MIRTVLATLLIAAIPCAALAQTVVPPPVPSIIPPPPPPPAPPPPRIEVPPVPKMDAPPTAPVKSQPRRSFNDRAIDCLDDSYAARLSPGDRVAYSRSCANRAE